MKFVIADSVEKYIITNLLIENFSFLIHSLTRKEAQTKKPIPAFESFKKEASRSKLKFLIAI